MTIILVTGDLSPFTGGFHLFVGDVYSLIALMVPINPSGIGCGGDLIVGLGCEQKASNRVPDAN